MKRFGKISEGLIAILLVIAFTFGIATPMMAQTTDTETYEFVSCTNNDDDDVDTGEAQLSLIVSRLAGGNIVFRFENAGPNASSITDVYFHDPMDDLVDLVAIRDSGAGVSFSEGAAPPNLPGANNCPDLPDADGFISAENADSNSPTQPNGVNPGEWLEIEMQTTLSFADIVSGLSTGLLRVGIHVQGFAGDGSESFVNRPDPTYIQLDAFDITPTDAGVLVEWATATEIDNAGFNLYRASSLAGPYEKINSQLIAAAGSAAQYEYTDADGQSGDFYRLEDIDFNGVATLHVPFEAKAAQFDNFIFIPMVQTR